MILRCSIKLSLPQLAQNLSLPSLILLSYCKEKNHHSYNQWHYAHVCHSIWMAFGWHKNYLFKFFYLTMIGMQHNQQNYSTCLVPLITINLAGYFCVLYTQAWMEGWPCQTCSEGLLCTVYSCNSVASTYTFNGHIIYIPYILCLVSVFIIMVCMSLYGLEHPGCNTSSDFLYLGHHEWNKLKIRVYSFGPCLSIIEPSNDMCQHSSVMCAQSCLSTLKKVD